MAHVSHSSDEDQEQGITAVWCGNTTYQNAATTARAAITPENATKIPQNQRS